MPYVNYSCRSHFAGEWRHGQRNGAYPEKTSATGVTAVHHMPERQTPKAHDSKELLRVFSSPTELVHPTGRVPLVAWRTSVLWSEFAAFLSCSCFGVLCVF